jgi:hypothetical protein
MGRFVEIPAPALIETIESIGTAVEKRGGWISRSTSGREVVYDLSPHKGRGHVRVFTSLANGEATVRDCGKDAVRIVVGHNDNDGRFRPHGKGRRIYRTAPAGDESARVTAFLDRLKGALREAYGAAMVVPECPLCEATMARRKTKATGSEFWGCSRFPDCRGSRPC